MKQFILFSHYFFILYRFQYKHFTNVYVYGDCDCVDHGSWVWENLWDWCRSGQWTRANGLGISIPDGEASRGVTKRANEIEIKAKARQWFTERDKI